MAKRADVSLTVTARNLATKDLKEISSLLDNITKSQNEQASSASLAAKGINQLKIEERELAAAMRELERRNTLVEKFKTQQAAVKDLAASLVLVRQRLNDLKAGTAIGFNGKQAAAEIKRTSAELGRLESKTRSAVAALTKTGASLDAIGVHTKEAATSFARLGVESSRTKGLMEANASAMQRYEGAVEETNAANATAAAREREVAAEAKRRTQVELQESQRRVAAFNAEIAAKAQRAQRLRDAVDTFGGGGAMDAATAAANRQAAADTRLLGIEQRFAEVMARKTAAQREALGVTATGIPVINREAAATNAAAVSKDHYGSAARKAAIAGGLFADTGRKSLSVYQRLRGQILQVGAAYLGIYQAVGLLTSAVQADQQRQQIRTQLLVVEGNNAERAAETYKFLRTEADRLGLQFETLAKNYANYAISAKAAGLTTLQTRDSFTQVATSVTGLRLSTEDADRVFRAYTQILSKGKVQAEELRGQLGDALPGAFTAFAKSMGVSSAALNKLMKDGKVGIADLVKFIKDYEAQFQATLPKTTSTLLADLNRLKNVYNDFLTLLSQGGTSKALQETINQLSGFFKSQDGVKFAQQLSEAFTLAVQTIQFLIRHFGTLLTLLKLFIGLQVAKAFYGMSLGLVSFGRNVVTTTKWLLGLRTALVAAAASTGALSVASRGLLVALGPVGLAIAALAGITYFLATRQTAAEEAADQHREALDRLVDAEIRGEVPGRRMLAQLREENAARLAVAKAALLELEAKQQLVNHVAKLQKADRGGGVAMVAAQGDSQVAGQRALIAELEKNQAEFDARAKKNLDDTMANIEMAQALADEKPAPPDVATDDDEDKKKDKKAKELADARKRTEQEVANAIKAIDRDLLQAQQKTLDQRLKLIDFDIDARIEELKKIQAEAAAQGQPEEVTRIDAAIKQLNVLREITKVEETRNFNLEKTQENEQKINDLLQQREAIVEAVNLLQQAGALTATQAHDKIEAANARLLPQIDELVLKAQEFINALGNTPEAAAAQATLDNIKAKVVATRNELSQTQRAWLNLGTTLAGGIVDTVGVLAKGLAGAITGANSLADAFKGARDAFLNFAADFLIQIGQMILKAILLKALQNFISGGKGGFLDAVVGAFSQHTGGIAGKDGKPRFIPAEALAGVRKFHDGGMPGLKKDEVLTVLQKGEEVLTEDNPRHIGNGGGGGGSPWQQRPLEVTVMNSIDSVDMLQKAAGTAAGKQVIFNVVRQNRAEFKQILS